MRQEEKLVQDVYLTPSEQWDLPIFANIAKVESRRMAAIGGLLLSRSLPSLGRATSHCGNWPRNRRMLDIFRHCGFTLDALSHRDTVLVAKDLSSTVHR